MKKREVMALAAQGKGCLGKAADDEEIFVLRAQDILAARTVRGWAQLASDLGVSESKVDEAALCARRMENWPDRKIPT